MLNLVIASKNRGKIKEIQRLLSDFPVRIRSLEDFPDITGVEETGKTFTENAELKARSYARQTNCWALADDSGLEVLALNDEPGIYSARFAGINATDKENNIKLLDALKSTPENKRQARFICVMIVSDEKGRIKCFSEGICNGRIAFQPRGKNGFGYDPLFIPDGYDNTFGELSEEIKEKISHRSKALKNLTHFFTRNMSS
jgi:XTP/dITP diphosphohydrolase